MVNPGDAEKAAGEEESLLKDDVPMVEIKSPKNADAAGDSAEAGSGSSTEKKPTLEFVGLTNEELEQFAKDPFWRRLRMVLFVLFWAIWLAMLAAVIVIILVSPKCPPRPTRYFWQKPFYRMQVRSFAPSSMASDDAGKLGSIAGLRSKLKGYLRGQLGLQNFMIDSLVARNASGCVADFEAMNEKLGSFQEVASLTKLGRKKGFNFLMEFDASQAADAWSSEAGDFDTRSLGGGGGGARSRDGKPIFSSGRVRTPRGACGSLNVSSATVRGRLQRAMSRWLDVGLSGFVLTNVAFLLPSDAGGEYGGLFSNASVEFVAETRRFLDAEADRRGRELALFVDAGDVGQELSKLGPDASANRLLRYADAGANAVVSTSLGQPLAAPSAGRLSAEQLRSVASAASAANARLVLASNWPYLRRRPDAALTALCLTLPGVPALYYGQELGMAHVPNVQLTGRDANPSYLAGNESTDASQTPMQWSGGVANAGWLPNATQWLSWAPDLSPRAGDIRANNLATLNSSGHPASTLQLTAQLINEATNVESLQWGSLRLLPAGGEVVAFARKAERFPSAIVVANVGNRSLTVSLPKDYGEGELLAAHSWGGEAHAYEVGEKYQLASVYSPANSLLLFLASDE